MKNQRILEIGINRGIERCLEHFDLTDKEVETCSGQALHFADRLKSKFATRPKERRWNPRGWSILMEIITIGLCSREEYKKEEPLTYDEVAVAADILEKIFNSWVHK